ncbi:MAG: LysM peptidoglycan-binding domain-containing protein, partial [Elusimicrobia bacterium]|nr:LysM peptidoglycan-binding domain-containing protein [Elusimicrobiota bacterium]
MYRISLFLTLFISSFSAAQQEVQSIVIKPGQTLWDISNKYLKDPTKWDVLVRYNNLSPDPSKALPGMTIKIPSEL